MTDIVEFNLPKDRSSIIKVIGVGGGGSNAVNHMYHQGIKGVDFILCNTDAQALDSSPVPNKIQLGTSGLGAGAVPTKARDEATEKVDEIRRMLGSNTKMLFITAGMGGGTGTGAAPVIAEIAKELGILTVGIVTLPFAFEGRKRKQQAEMGIKELRSYVDTLLVVCNDKLRQLFGNLKLSKAFSNADNVLTTAAKGIAEIITETGYINVDFEDVKTVMSDSGVAIMGNATAEGENRASKAIEEALASPLLNDNDIKGASDILLYISSGNEEEILMDEITEITDYIQEAAGQTAEIIWGNGFDENLGKKISVTLVATGFSKKEDLNTGLKEDTNTTRIIHKLNPNKPAEPETSKPYEDKDPAPEIKLVPPKQYINETADTTSLASEQSTPKINSEQKQERTGTIHKLYDEDNDQREEPESLTRSQVDNDTKTTATEQSNQKEIMEREKSREERRKKLQGYSLLNTKKCLEEMEREPAYIRKAVKLKEVKPSGESHISRYSLFDDSTSGPEIRPNNSFLHDNVD